MTQEFASLGFLAIVVGLAGCTGAADEVAEPPFDVKFYVMNERTSEIEVQISAGEDVLFNVTVPADDRGGTVEESNMLRLQSSPLDLKILVNDNAEGDSASESLMLFKETHVLVRISSETTIETFDEPPQFS